MALGPQNMQGPAFSVEDLCTLEPLPDELSNQLATWQVAQEKVRSIPGYRFNRPGENQNSSKDKNRNEEQRRIPLREFRTINQFNHDISTGQVIRNYRRQFTYNQQISGKDSYVILKKNIKPFKIEKTVVKEKPATIIIPSRSASKNQIPKNEVPKVGSTASTTSVKSTQRTKAAGKEKESAAVVPKPPAKSKTPASEVPCQTTRNTTPCYKEPMKMNVRNKPSLEPNWMKWLAKRRSPKKEVAVCSTLQLGDEYQNIPIPTTTDECDENGSPNLKFETPPLRHYLPQIQKPAIIGIKKNLIRNNAKDSIECHQTNLILPNINRISSQINLFQPAFKTTCNRDLSDCLSITSMNNNITSTGNKLCKSENR